MERVKWVQLKPNFTIYPDIPLEVKLENCEDQYEFEYWLDVHFDSICDIIYRGYVHVTNTPILEAERIAEKYVDQEHLVFIHPIAYSGYGYRMYDHVAILRLRTCA